MNGTLLIFTAIATFAVAGAVACSSVAPESADGAGVSQATNSIPIGNESWTARMGWRYAAHVEGDVSLWLSIEPMVKGDDQVYVPNEASWLKAAPSDTERRRAEILSHLKSVVWNRKLSWHVSVL